MVISTLVEKRRTGKRPMTSLNAFPQLIRVAVAEVKRSPPRLPAFITLINANHHESALAISPLALTSDDACFSTSVVALVRPACAISFSKSISF